MTIAGRRTTIRKLTLAQLRKLPVHRYAGIFRVLEGDERELLRQSLSDHGYDESAPIVVSERTGEIVDGRNRRDIAVDLKLASVPVAFVKFPSDRDIAVYITHANLARRHLNARDRAKLAKTLAEVGFDTSMVAAAVGLSRQRTRALTTAERATAKAERDQAIRAQVANGKPARRVARELGIDESTVRAVRENARDERNPAPRARRRVTAAPIEPIEMKDSAENAALILRLSGVTDDDAVETIRLLGRLRKTYGSEKTAEQVMPCVWRLLELAGQRDPAAVFLKSNTMTRNGEK